jgi:tyrosine-protein kinase Etk/Wzc
MNKPTPPPPEFQQPYYFEEDTISLTDIMLILARQLKVIIITPTILCTLTIINVLFFTKPVYTSTAKIMSSSTSGGVSQAAGLAAKFGINIPTGQSEPKWVYPEIIKSRTLARSMLKRKFDTNKFGNQKNLLQILTYGNDDPKVGLDTLEIIAVDNFLGMIDISENMQTAILTLSINASEPNFAAEVNQTLIEELDAHQRKYNKTKTSDTKQFIEERIIDTEKELMVAEESLKVFMDRNRRIENSPALQLEQQRLGREVTVLTGVFTTLKQQLETTKIEEVKESDYVVILDSPEVPLKRSKPNKRLIVILAGFLGLGLGMVLAFIREYVTNSDKEEKDKLFEAKSLVFKNLSELIPGKSK